ncbi:ABC transporter ATP-binding protein [Martelella mangrovi]|uniref:Iron complex transport system ATP-binding protein n=1 Tax=Martelella mangrovi TaxID=1397477 RepID=A0ABV2I6F1_9HYPH
MLLEADKLTVRIGGRAIVDNVAFSVGHGELVGLIGPNGAGKSTLLRACLGLIEASGDVSLLQMPLAQMTPLQRARVVAYLPQDHEIAWAVAVRRVVGLGRQPWRESGEAGGQIVARAMERMGVDTLAERRADTLSGGERARVLIARALAQTTPLLVADEPVAGLDPAHQIALMEVFVSLLREGRSVVCSLHDLGLAARWCTRLVMLSEGRVVAEGTPETVLTAENLRRVYGVEAFFGHADGGPVVMPTGLSGK